MNDEGPQLEALTHRLAACPPEFVAQPKTTRPSRGGSGGGGSGGDSGIDLPAVVGDHFRATGGTWMPPVENLTAYGGADGVNRLKLIAVATWLLHDEWFLARPQLARAMWMLLSTELNDLAALVKADDAVRDADRREELVRVCLKHLGLRPKGETVAQATDRLNTLDSAERLKVVRQTRDAEARARKIREQMAAEAARAAAARYSPE